MSIEKKVIATCGIRKLLDFVFNQTELFWLDDILPSSAKSKKQTLGIEKVTLNNTNDSSSEYCYKDFAKQPVKIN